MSINEFIARRSFANQGSSDKASYKEEIGGVRFN